MRHRPTWRLILPLLAGACVAIAWIAWTDASAILTRLSAVQLTAVLPLGAVTAAWFLLRFVRSQFLLRRVGVRVPIRPALATYLAALPGTATPAYVGEAIRSVFLRRRFGTPMRLTLPLLVMERCHDLLALALLAACTGTVGGVGVATVAGTLAILGLAGVRALLARMGVAPAAVARLHRPVTVGISLVLSVGAWLVTGALLWFVAGMFGGPLSPLRAVGIFSTSTLAGALSLSPAGAGVTGSVAIVQLQGAGHELVTAVSIVTVVRLVTTGLALTIGAVFLWREIRGPAPAPELVAHFDTIAGEYAAQWSPHMWDLLLGRKLGLMEEALPPPSASGVGVDFGCGLGLQTAELRRRGHRVIGVEPSVGLLRQRPARDLPVIAADGLALPLADQSVDFVYAIGVLHHLPGPAAQAAARDEIARVLKPGGVLLVHESNPRNPFFRFYMGYIFPLLKSIDEGTEHWIEPRSWRRGGGLRLEAVKYFTFLPDFTPRPLMRAALAIERALERGPTRGWSAHYMAILRKGPSLATSGGEPTPGMTQRS